MKYRIQQYAQALYEAMEGKKPLEQKEIVKRFVALLARQRVLGKMRLIIAACEKIILQKTDMRKVRIESASPITEKLKKEIGEILGKKVYLEETENPNLLAGIKILVDNELLINASAQRQLEKIFVKR